ncbi:hypothetical protein LPICM02_120053 [Pseudolactococcus piscium]|nr:hypothetical protein LPICM02_120053 [Lactococcus piscium]
MCLIISFHFSIVNADTTVQGLTLTDGEYTDLLSSVPKGSEIVSNDEYDKFAMRRSPTGLLKNAHIEGYGWQGFSTNSFVGTTGEGLRMEAIRLNFSGLNTDITYSTHLQRIGWTPNVSNGAVSGTTGQSRRIEAIEISTSGRYLVLYRGHVQGNGWGPWHTSAGPPNPMQSFVGTTGQSKRLETLELIILKRG